MLAVIEDPPRERHRHPSPRMAATTTVSGAAIAVGACENEAQAQRFSDAARAAGVPVNVIDKPKFCDFAFGAIVNRSPMVIGISTDGAAPVFGQAIRGKLEAMIPRGFAQWAEAARRWRADVRRRVCRSMRGGGSGSCSPSARCAARITSRRNSTMPPAGAARAEGARSSRAR